MVAELENLKSDFTIKENATDTLMVTPRGLTSSFSDGSKKTILKVLKLNFCAKL